MITDEEETVAGFNIDLNSDLGFQEDDEDSFMCASNDQPMSYHQDDLMINEGFMNFQFFYLYLYITTYMIFITYLIYLIWLLYFMHSSNSWSPMMDHFYKTV